MERDFWQAECERAVEDYVNGAVARWVVCLHDDPHRVIGRVNYTQIARGPFQSCMLGYAIDGVHEGRGLMREALEATIEHVFTVIGLHRIQASFVPDNHRSGRLLERLGFAREGLAKNYLYINGAWRDHVLTARLNPAFDTSIFSPRPFRPA
jgi:ribosomal-protein-alanine N-acetyltransferase